MNGERYRVIRFEDVEWKRGHCGALKRLLSEDISFDFVRIEDAKKHFHKKTKEYYFIVRGEGEIELNDDVIKVKEGDLVVIEPGTLHRARGNMEVLVIGFPALSENDMFSGGKG